MIRLFQQVLERLRAWYFYKVFLVFFWSLLALLLIMGIFYQNPRIDRIEPPTAKPGDVITIVGSGLGSDPYSSWVSIDGRRIAATNIMEWTPDRVSVRVPYNAFSGLVEVHTGAGVTRGELFINQDQLPVLASARADSAWVDLAGVSPAVPVPGTVVSIRGKGFGTVQGRRYFRWGATRLADADVMSWTDSEVKVLAPFEPGESTLVMVEAADGDAPEEELGRLTVRMATPGVSQGQRATRNVRLRFGYSAGDISVFPEPSWGRLGLHAPVPPDNPGQSVRFDGFSGNYRRKSLAPQLLDLYLLQGFQPDTNYDLALRYRVSLHTFTPTVNPVELPMEVAPDGLKHWLGASPMVPLGDRTLQTFVQNSTKGLIHPWEKAQNLLWAVIDLLEYEDEGGLTYGPEVFKDRRASSFGYSSLMAALGRLAGIPSRMVEGMVTGPGNKVRNERFWVEIFIPGLGWVTADPALADEKGQARPVLGARDGEHLGLMVEGTIRGLTRLDDGSQQVYGKFVLLDAHSFSAGNVDSYGLSIIEPSIEN